MPNKNAVKPTWQHPKDKQYHFYRYFGATEQFPDDFDVDAHITNPNQNADNRPTECTAYTICDIGTDQDGILYSHDYHYMSTLEAMNAPSNSSGADARTAFKVATAIGLLPKELEPANIQNFPQAWAANPANWPGLASKTVRKGNYLPISVGPSKDWFDAIKSAVLLSATVGEKRPVGMATQWAENFNTTVLSVSPVNLYWGHMYKVRGWKKEYPECLWLKTWEGVDRFMPRVLVNKLMSTWGSYAATIQDLPPEDAAKNKEYRATIIEILIALLQNLRGILSHATSGFFRALGNVFTRKTI